MIVQGAGANEAAGEDEAASYAPAGPEFTVNSTYERSQYDSAVARLANGNFVVVWYEATPGTSVNRLLKGQVFSADGAAVGGELTLGSGGSSPTVAGLTGGGFVVAWTNGGLYARLFDDGGSAAAPAFQIIQSTVNAFGQNEPDVAALAGGGFAVAWEDERTAGGDADRLGVHLRAFDRNGAAVGGDVLVNSATFRSQFDASVAAFADGGYVVSWTDTGAGGLIKARLFDAAGAKIGGEIVVANTASVGSSVAVLANGNFAVAWYSSSAHHVQVFTAAGVPVGAEASVATALGGVQVGPELTALADGGYALAWTTEGAELPGDGSGRSIAVQVFDAEGQPVGGPQLANGQTGGNQAEPGIVGLGDGKFVVSWSDANGTGADDDEVKARIFTNEIVVPNERPTIVSDGGGTSSTGVRIREGETAVTTVVATDDGAPGPVVYSITGGGDAGLFVIDAATGVLSLAAAPDYEAPVDGGEDNFYNVVVTASDGELSTFQLIQFLVENVNEGVSITSGSGGDVASVSADESHPYVIKVAAADVDGDALAFSISGGADAALFEIDALTGDLFFLATPDFEAPADADGDNVYEVAVRASDGEYGDHQHLSVTVGNVDEDLAIVSYAGAGSVALAMSENGRQVGAVAAVDPDGGPVAYSISGGADAGLFAIDPDSGALTFVFDDRPDFEAPADADGDNVYEVTVVAASGASSAAQAFAVTVVNENEGIFISSNGGGTSAAIAVGENNAAVTNVVGYDPDGTVPAYAILGGADASLFTIDAATGALAFVSAPDFEAPGDADGDNVYDVDVGASDGTYTTWQTLQVTVGNVNEGVAITSAATASVLENETAAAAIAASDADGDSVAYAIAGGADAALFAIDAATGALRFLSAPDFEAPADADGDNIYAVLVSASDGAFTAIQSVAVAVDDVNEGVTISSGGGGASSSVTVAETQAAVSTVAASDADGGAVAYAVAGGADAHLFAIDAATGALAFLSAPNFEAPGDVGGDNVYEVVVSASDGTFADSQAVSVRVGDVNEALAITSNGGGASASLSIGENGRNVTTVAATDPEGAALVYAIAGGADAARFTIHAATGALAFAVAPNHEAPGDAGANNVYEVVVSASDGAFSDSQALSVTVTNVREGNTIVGTSASNTISTTSSVSGQPRATELEDTIYGLGGSDTLSGGGGADIIDGGAGNDAITGGLGADTLIGGTGTDRFVLASAAESNVAAPDLIVDFIRAEGDKINLSALDANLNSGGNQSFAFIGAAAFSNRAGQLRYEQSGGDTFVSGDVNGDGKADFLIQLDTAVTLIASDFLL